MKKEDLIDAIGNLDEKKIERAGKRMENENREKRSFAGWRTALVAACFAGIVAVVALPIMSKEESLNIPQGEIIPGNVITEGKDGGEEKEGVANLYAVVNDNIVINRDTVSHTGNFYIPMDCIKREEYSKMKMSGDAWAQITEYFEREIGISYENFGSNIPEMWELSEFYGVTVRSYINSTPALDEYVLSDYGFSYSGGGEKAAFVSVSSKENPFLTIYYNFEPFKDSVSTINSIPMIIVENNSLSLYHASFKVGALSYYIAFVECTQEEVVDFLHGLVTFSVTVDDEGDAGIYAGAITPEMLTAETEDIFCGAYIDGSDYVVLLTDVNEENVDVVCTEFGIDKNTAVFKKAEYTLSYLTELHEKITEKMMAREYPFVITSGVYESENCIMVGVLEGTEESEKEMVLELDRLGGAIEFEITQAMSTELLAVAE